MLRDDHDRTAPIRVVNGQNPYGSGHVSDSSRQLNTSSLLSIAKDLEIRTETCPDIVIVGVETGLDEAFYIGTRYAYVRLAATLLRIAATEGDDESIDGVNCLWSPVSQVDQTVADNVSIRGGFVVDTDLDRKRLEGYFQRRTFGF
jgi:hypothetical protein